MKPKHRLIAIRFSDDLPETEPLVMIPHTTFDQARESLRIALKAASQPHGMTPEEVSLVRAALTAMETT